MMKDRHKYRVWDGEKMHYPYCIAFYENNTWIANGLYVQPSTGYGSEHEITHSNKGELMQCTGIKDREGNLIWEGDVVRGCYWIELVPNAVVVWGDASAMWLIRQEGIISKELHHASTLEQLEIIGNIYENKDLLK